MDRVEILSLACRAHSSVLAGVRVTDPNASQGGRLRVSRPLKYAVKPIQHCDSHGWFAVPGRIIPP